MVAVTTPKEHVMDEKSREALEAAFPEMDEEGRESLFVHDEERKTEDVARAAAGREPSLDAKLIAAAIERAGAEIAQAISEQTTREA
jgi:hypothetical protein